MVDKSKLRQKLRESGIKTRFLCGKIGICPTAFYSKLNGKTEFTAREIQVICEVLGINTYEELASIFFADVVDK